MEYATVKQIIAGFSIIVCLFLSSAGCAPKQPKDEVVMWLVGSEAQARSINELALRFTQETGIKVICEAVSWGEAHSKYLTSIAGNVPPDIGTMGFTWGAEFGEMGAMIDLKKEFPAEVERIEKNTFSGLWKSINYRGRVYGIPLDITIHVMYYRSDIVPVPPQTWDQLIELLKKLKAEGRGMLFDWGSMDWIGLSPFLWQAGGKYYDDDYSASTVDSQQAALGMKFYTDLYTVYGVPKTSIPLEQGMRTGDFPVCISGNWKIVGLTIGAPEIKDKWAISKLPAGPSGRSTAFIGGRTMGIFARSNNKVKAWAFIKYLYRPESQAFLYSNSIKTQDAYLPPNMDSWSKLTAMDQRFKAVLMAQALDAKGPPPVLGWDNTVRFIDQAIQRIILQNAKAEDELKLLKGLMDIELKKNNK